MSSLSALDSLLSGSSSTSSINLSQILEAALGASSEGIDVNSAVSAAITAAEAPEQTWESQLTLFQNQTTALNQLQTYATNLDNDMQSLNNILGPLSAMTVSSSNSSVVSGTASSGSTAGNHIVVVNNLATTASWTSAAFASGSTALPAGSFTITTGTGATTITTDGTETLSDAANQINSDGLGLTASVITDATGARLAIVANSSGSAANFTISNQSPSSFGFAQAASGLNASVNVDGITIASATNTVTGVIPGVTLNLQSASPDTQISLSVTPDTSQASTAIDQFVSDYNTLLQAVNSQFADSGSGQGVLATDPTIRDLQSDLEGAMGYTSTLNGTTSSLASLGISVNSDGTLSVDSGALNSAMQNNFSAVQNFFQGSAFNGFAGTLDQQLTGFISPSDGAFTVDLQSISTQESAAQTSITNFQTNVITPLQQQLQSEYSQAEILLQQLPTEMKQIDEELGLNNSNG